MFELTYLKLSRKKNTRQIKENLKYCTLKSSFREHCMTQKCSLVNVLHIRVTKYMIFVIIPEENKGKNLSCRYLPSSAILFRRALFQSPSRCIMGENNLHWRKRFAFPFLSSLSLPFSFTLSLSQKPDTRMNCIYKYEYLKFISKNSY